MFSREGRVTLFVFSHSSLNVYSETPYMQFVYATGAREIGGIGYVFER